MDLGIILFYIFSYKIFVSCYGSDSSEINKVDYPPIYDAIIFSDIAEVLNDLENQYDLPVRTTEETSDDEVDSIEDIPNLLAEYQNHLEKAQKQRLAYLQKFKNKNAPLRHTKHSKPKSVNDYDEFFVKNDIQPDPETDFTQTQADFILPLNTRYPIHDLQNFMNGMVLMKPEVNPIEFNPNVIQTVNGPLKSSCICKSDEFPCTCKCKQCIVESNAQTPKSPIVKKLSLPYPFFLDNSENKELNKHDLNINIRINVDIPKLQTLENTRNCSKSESDIFSNKDSQMKDSQTVKIPFPYYNYPVPSEFNGYKKKIDQDTTSAIHIVHKKKKSKSNNSNKRHRKKIITFHSFEPSQYAAPIPDENVPKNQKVTQNLKTPVSINIVQSKIILNTSSPIPSTSALPIIKARDQLLNSTPNNASLIITKTHAQNNTEIERNDDHKNSIETDYAKISANVPSSTTPNRTKRESLNKSASTNVTIVESNDLSILRSDDNTEKSSSVLNITAGYKTFDINNVTNSVEKWKSIDTERNNNTSTSATILKDTKVFISESDLLLWPHINRNVSLANSKNITRIILEREKQKAKMNMTKEAIHKNTTEALEKAIFGDVNWDDVDTVAPIFMSSVGKYLNGIITFCSDKTCHSMKCGEKVCIHRTCKPEERVNKNGHCGGSNETDSIALMESLMDLPFNVAFEIVDILQDKMLGKMYGKATLCISSKCMTFVTTKKVFLKSKCGTKDINTTGHCTVQAKNVKF